MVKQAHRLGRSQDIQRVLKTGRRQKTSHVSVYRTSSPAEVSRFTCIVGKKVSPSAVVRHKIQRWLREVGRELIRTAATPTDIVIVAYPSITDTKSLADLKKSVLG